MRPLIGAEEQGFWQLQLQQVAHHRLLLVLLGEETISRFVWAQAQFAEVQRHAHTVEEDVQSAPADAAEDAAVPEEVLEVALGTGDGEEGMDGEVAEDDDLIEEESPHVDWTVGVRGL